MFKYGTLHNVLCDYKLYNKKTKKHTFMVLFTGTGKLEKFFVKFIMTEKIMKRPVCCYCYLLLQTLDANILF
jgi:hypothetical protein